MEEREKQVILVSAIKKYGIAANLDIAIEEMSELTQAIIKLKRQKNHNIEEEIADVEITLEKIKMMSMLVDHKKVEEWKDKKLKRLKERICREEVKHE